MSEFDKTAGKTILGCLILCAIFALIGLLFHP